MYVQLVLVQLQYASHVYASHVSHVYLLVWNVCFQLLEYRSTENSAAGRPAGVKGTMARGSRRAITCAGRGACRTSYVCDCIHATYHVPARPPTLPPFYPLAPPASAASPPMLLAMLGLLVG